MRDSKKINMFFKNDTLFIYKRPKKLYDIKKIKLGKDAYNRIRTGNIYFLFFDTKNNLIEEGYWDYEVFEGYYKGYYKNGILKVEGILSIGVEELLWKYYNKKGKLKNEINYPKNEYPPQIDILEKQQE